MPIGRRNILRGCIAGMGGGLFASFVMGQVFSGVQKIVALPESAGEDSTVRTASALSHLILHRELTPSEKENAGSLVHYLFGASVGAVYGAAAEYAPLVTAGWGAFFGLGVWLGAHVIMVPALGLSEPIKRSTAAAEAPELAAHLAYGTVVETVRRFLARS